MSKPTAVPPLPTASRPRTATPLANQREHERQEVAIGAEVTFGRDDSVPARTHDLSLGGVRLVLSRAVKDGDALVISLLLTEDGVEDPDCEPLTLKAVAVWSSETDAEGLFIVGARFIAMREAEREILSTFLARASLAS